MIRDISLTDDKLWLQSKTSSAKFLLQCVYVQGASLATQLTDMALFRVLEKIQKTIKERSFPVRLSARWYDRFKNFLLGTARNVARLEADRAKVNELQTQLEEVITEFQVCFLCHAAHIVDLTSRL
jgi:hypothetical protein